MNGCTEAVAVASTPFPLPPTVLEVGLQLLRSVLGRTPFAGIAGLYFGLFR